MRRKILLLVIFLIMILISFAGCNSKDDIKNEVENKVLQENIIETEEVSKAYNWVVEPKLDVDDIIDLDTRENVSIVKKGNKYNIINDDGDEILRKDFFSYAMFDSGEFYFWEEGGTKYQFNEDYTFTEVEYSGDFVHNVVYYNTQRKELFTQNYMYIAVSDDESLLKKFKEKHGTELEYFIEVTPKSFIDDEFDKYAEFSEKDLGKSGYYNKRTLEIVISPVYDKALNYYEGYAAVKKDGKAGFIDFDGKELFPFEFEETRSFDNGKAWVKVEGKWGLIELVK